MVMPAGLLTDIGCADLRRHLFEACRVDAIVSLDNRDGLFPIHRGVRFALLTATTGSRTEELCLTSGVRDAAVLDDIPDHGPPGGCVRIPMAMVTAFGGEGRAVPDLAAELDRAVLARVLSAGPPLDSPDGWHVALRARAERDRRSRPLRQRAGLPVARRQAARSLSRATWRTRHRFIDRARRASACSSGRTSFDRARLGYREVASATNRLTLIAAIVPAGTRDDAHDLLPARAARRRPAVVPVRRVQQLRRELLRAACAAARTCRRRSFISCRCRGPCDEDVLATRGPGASGRGLPAAEDRARLQAAVARLYGLRHDELAHVLSTFPLIAPDERAAVLQSAKMSGL